MGVQLKEKDQSSKFQTKSEVDEEGEDMFEEDKKGLVSMVLRGSGPIFPGTFPGSL